MKTIIDNKPSFNPTLPVVISISGNWLQKNGWERKGSTYTKNSHILTYDGVTWLLNGKETVQFTEDLPNE